MPLSEILAFVFGGLLAVVIFALLILGGLYYYKKKMREQQGYRLQQDIMDVLERTGGSVRTAYNDDDIDDPNPFISDREL
jgi:ethanolamine transporter EutH